MCRLCLRCGYNCSLGTAENVKRENRNAPVDSLILALALLRRRRRCRGDAGRRAAKRAAVCTPLQRAGSGAARRAFPKPPSRRTASASPIPCVPPTWTPTRAAPASGCSTPASTTPRPCGSPIWRPTRCAPEWSGDGRFLYYLSNRGGSSQVWRLAGTAGTGEPAQVTSAARCRLLPRRAQGRSRSW